MDVVQEVREFNRFYTRLVGLLDEHLPDSGLSLPEGRVLYELATAGGQAAADLTRTLGMDKAQLSRVVRTLTGRGLLASEVDPAHGKRRLLSLTPSGRDAFAALDAGTRRRMATVLQPLAGDRQQALVHSMHAIQGAFDAQQALPVEVTLRAPVPGDLGWVIHRQAVLYAREYGWDWTYEALIARILGDYATGFDAAREDGWIAERGGEVVGSIFLMKGDTPDIARLRLLYVEPHARGLGVGRRLVDTCIARARQLRYRQLTLWTNDVLVSARRIYEAAGFSLTAQAPHRAFGRDLVEQTWELEL
ncbi:GNAT family N-acetyltransferase [Luteimonas viscosa]|uniref:GNAT family N-acetyltransferase n=1 Tax=Luteimonas viscosa TaxID=1132694 RepID=A0A5D4XQE7_9GAMM|nr:bifunctional helix-turn-helix transcriptional regulator/GNAT family N-acetyltransferase [Luteimonas viscosa]TYT24950.1 GNAT family N-acetyltransferase [Luteimonas viscosa]